MTNTRRTPEDLGTDVEVPDSSARLVAYLALGDRPRPRPSLANTLWSEPS